MQVLIISPDTISEKMAGPGIRYYELARQLSREFMVTISVPNHDCPPSEERLTFCDHKPGTVQSAYKKCSVVICQGYITNKFPFLLEGVKPLVIDLYDLIHLEELTKNCLLQKSFQSYSHIFAYILKQLKYGDFFICASERQRDFWLGMLSAVNRINPSTFENDPTMRNLISVVPFGIRANFPRQTKRVLKGEYPNIGRSDKIILWAGGIWDWLDPLTPIKAMHIISRKRNDVKLFFMGTKRPFPDSGNITQIASKAVNLSKELDLFDKSVFFNNGWVPYHERHNYLLESDIGITTYKQTLETHFSYRTRILDYIWAEVPVVCNEGDSLSEMIYQKGLGILLHDSNEKKLADIILYLLDNKAVVNKIKKNMKQVKDSLTWEKAVVPLQNFCRQPEKAADKKLK